MTGRDGPFSESSSSMKAKARVAWRNMGYRDGLANRPARSLEAEYQAGWRAGQRRREELRRPLTDDA